MDRSWGRKALRAATVAAMAGAMSLTVAGAAYAADSNTVQVNGWQLVFNASDADDQIQMSRSGDTYFFWANREIATGSGCWRPVPTEGKLAQCTAVGVGQIVVWAHGGDDGVNTLTPNMNTPLFMSGEAGNDTLLGQDGNDVILGGSGNDTLIGFAGNDEIFGNDGNDAIFASAGDDTVYGDAGNDQLVGDDGHDTIEGGTGADEINGGTGEDVLLGQDQDDQLFGGEHHDRVDGGSGNNLVDGGPGPDDCFNGPRFRNCP
jgi:Ca2+-binding RTX toxin-like protein